MKLVILRKENWVTDYVITMFSIINDSISKKKLD